MLEGSEIVTYCYKLSSGEIVERIYEMGAAPQKVKVKGKGIAMRDFQAEGVSGQMVGTDNPTRAKKGPSQTWPMPPCVGSGVHPEQAGELRGHFKKHGLNIEVNSNGDPIYESAIQRRKALKCRRMHDRASYS